MNRAAVIILNYNMPEAADKWVRTIKERVQYPHDLIVVDNGSDKVNPSQYTTIRVEKNIRTTGGYRIGIEYADMLGLIERDRIPEYYWTISTSTELDYCNGDPLEMLVKEMDRPESVSVAPAYVGTLTGWTHQNYECDGSETVKQIIPIPTATLLVSEWYHQVGGFEQRLTHSWGVEHDLAFMAARMNKTSWLHNGVRVRVHEAIGYKMDRMDTTRDEKGIASRHEMNTILTDKYGDMWIKIHDEEDYKGIIDLEDNK